MIQLKGKKKLACLMSHVMDLSRAPLTSQLLAGRVLRDAVHRWQELLPKPEATGLSMRKRHAVSIQIKKNLNVRPF